MGEKCDKEERNRHYVEHDRIVMEETGRIVLSFYTIAMCALMLMLTNPSKKRDATTLKGLSDSPEMQNKLISFFEFTKEATQEVFGEHNSIKKMMKNEIDNMEDEILCFLSFVGDDDHSREKFCARHEKFKRLDKFNDIRETIKSDINKIDDRILCSLAFL